MGSLEVCFLAVIDVLVHGPLWDLLLHLLGSSSAVVTGAVRGVFL